MLVATVSPISQGKHAKVVSVKALVKKHKIQVSLNSEDAEALQRLTKLETQRRRELVGEATLLRELAMPRVRELLAQAKAAA